jgi:hypothetical protein
MEGKELAPEVAPIITSQLHRGHTDEVSINALAAKWSRWFENLPEPTEEEERAGKELLALLDEARRLRAVRNST